MRWGASQNGRDSKAFFVLEQGVHSLPCELRLRQGDDVLLDDGMQIRVGGHLAFETKKVQYYLIARDVEVIGVETLMSTPAAGSRPELIQEEEALVSALASIKRRSEVAQQAPSSLPLWVQKLAPEEVQEDLHLEESVETVSEAAQTPILNEEAIAHLSAAMDSEEDVELTPEVLAQWLPESETSAQHDETGQTAVSDEEAQTKELKEWAASLADVDEEPDTAVRPYDPVTEAVPEEVAEPEAKAARKQESNWLVIIAIVVLVVLAFVLLLAILLQFMQ